MSPGLWFQVGKLPGGIIRGRTGRVFLAGKTDETGDRGRCMGGFFELSSGACGKCCVRAVPPSFTCLDFVPTRRWRMRHSAPGEPGPPVQNVEAKRSNSPDVDPGLTCWIFSVQPVGNPLRRKAPKPHCGIKAWPTIPEAGVPTKAPGAMPPFLMRPKGGHWASPKFGLCMSVFPTDEKLTLLPRGSCLHACWCQENWAGFPEINFPGKMGPV